MIQYFTAPDVWNGGYYELDLELGPRSHDMMSAALERLWSYPALDGCYLSRDREPGEQARVLPSALSARRDSRAHGLAQLPNGARVACGTLPSRIVPVVDTLVFYFPMGALETAYPVGAYPFEPAKASWKKPLDNWFAALARYVFEAIPFRLGLIGFEMAITAPRKRVLAVDVEREGVPANRWIGYLWPVHGHLEYFPPTLPDEGFIIQRVYSRKPVSEEGLN